MDSAITILLKKRLVFILPLLKRLNFTSLTIIAYGVILNAFGILNLLNNDFILFILLSSTAFMSQLISKIYNKKYNDSNKTTRLFGKVSIWIILLTTFYAIYIVYLNQINYTIIGLVIIISILCNINYTFKLLDKIENGSFEDDRDLNSIVIKKWAMLFKVISKEKRQFFSEISRHFDETMLVFYLFGIIIYLHTTKTVK